MSYRDDRDADQARIAALEAELAASKQELAQLKGNPSTALVVAGGGPLVRQGQKRWLGSSTDLELTRRFEAAFPVDRFEDLIVRIRAVTRTHGRTELLRSSMTWWAESAQRGVGPFQTVSVTIKDGATTLVVTDRLGELAGALFGAGGGVSVVGIVLPIFASTAVPWLAPVFFAGWLGGAYTGVRAIFKRAARKRADVLQQLFDAVADEISSTLRAM